MYVYVYIVGNSSNCYGYVFVFLVDGMVLDFYGLVVLWICYFWFDCYEDL